MTGPGRGHLRAAAVAMAVLAGSMVSTVVPGATAASAASGCIDLFDAGFDHELRARWPRNRFTAHVVDLRTGCEHDYRGELRVTTASVFKTELLAGVLLRAQRAGRGPSQTEHDRLWPMITESANAPATSLFHELGGSSGVARLHGELGLGQTGTPPPTWGLTPTSARDQAHLARQLLVADVSPFTARTRAMAWRYLGNVVGGQRWGLGEALPPGFRVGLKNGFAGSPCCGWRINTAGFVSDPRGGGWAAAILTDGWPTEAAGREAMSFVAGHVNGRLAAVTVPALCGPSTNPTAAPDRATASGLSVAETPVDDIVAVAPTTSGRGHWALTVGGGVHASGDAGDHGDLAGVRLNAPALGIDGTPRGDGYWVVAGDGGVFTFGAAPYHGSTGGLRLNQPVVSTAATPTGGGYWLVASDGGVFAFGDAGYFGSTGGLRLVSPVVGMAATPSGGGYWLLARDGGVFAFGDAPYLGSIPGEGTCWSAPAVRLRPTPSGRGYWVLTADGRVRSYGEAAAIDRSANGWPADLGAVDFLRVP